jgi:hypothetical protein
MPTTMAVLAARCGFLTGPQVTCIPCTLRALMSANELDRQEFWIGTNSRDKKKKQRLRGQARREGGTMKLEKEKEEEEEEVSCESREYVAPRGRNCATSPKS